MEPTLEEALALAIEAHRGQTYPAPEPEPFILHPIRVMLGVKSRTAQIVALLHDVVEDSPITLDDLEGQGFPGVVVKAVDCLSMRLDERYVDYINRVARNDLTREPSLPESGETPSLQH